MMPLSGISQTMPVNEETAHGAAFPVKEDVCAGRHIVERSGGLKKNGKWGYGGTSHRIGTG